MPNWNVPDNIAPGQQAPQRPMTPYAAYRAKNPLDVQQQTPRVTAPVPQPPGVPGMTAPNMQRPAAVPTPRQPTGIVRPQQQAIGYGAPGNPQKPWGT